MVFGVFEIVSEAVVLLAISSAAMAVGVASRASFSETTDPSLLFNAVLVCSSGVSLMGNAGCTDFRLDGKSGKEGNDASFGSSVLDGSAIGRESDMPSPVTTTIRLAR